MSRPQAHPTTCVYRARKVVPADLRAIIGKTELVASLGTKDPAVARRLFPEVMGRMEARLAAARAQLNGQPIRPTPREIASMAGEVYRAQVEFDEAHHLDAEALDAYLGHLDFQGRPGPRHIREAGAYLTMYGFSTDAEALDRMGGAIREARIKATHVALVRARGDWSPSPYAEHFPAEPPGLRPPPDPVPPAPDVLTFDALHEAYSKDNPRPAKTVDKRRSAFLRLARAIGHDDAPRVGKPEVRAFKTARQADGVHALTINDALAVLRPIWRWAADNAILPEGVNPFDGMAVSVPRGRPPKVPYSAEQAAQVLTASRSQKGFLRWVPWVLALTGCRLEEVCGAAREDVREESGVWCLVLHVEREGRTHKTGDSQRMVPLHPALEAEGFLAYVMALPVGEALFPDVPPGRTSGAVPTARRPWGVGCGAWASQTSASPRPTPGDTG